MAKTRVKQNRKMVANATFATKANVPPARSVLTHYGRVSIPLQKIVPLPVEDVGLPVDDANGFAQAARINLERQLPRFVSRDSFGNELSPGDHIFKTMPYELPFGSGDFSYYHHGLFLGSELVIHYSGMAGPGSTGRIEIVHIDEFACPAEIEVIPHRCPQFSPEDSVRRALSRQGENAYSILGNNCEHFVNWCIDGKHYSRQVKVAIDLIPFAVYTFASEIKKMFFNR